MLSFDVLFKFNIAVLRKLIETVKLSVFLISLCLMQLVRSVEVPCKIYLWLCSGRV